MVNLLDPEFGGKGKQIMWRGKKLGYLIKEKFGYTFVAPRKLKHFFRQYRGFAINSLLLEYLKQIGVRKIVIRVTSKKGEMIYISALSEWFDHGIRYRHPDYEPQIVLPLKYMKPYESK